MKRRHFRLIALLCLGLFVCGNLVGCGTNAPDGSKEDLPEINGDITNGGETDEEVESGGESSADNPFSGGLINGGSYEGN